MYIAKENLTWREDRVAILGVSNSDYLNKIANVQINATTHTLQRISQNIPFLVATKLQILLSTFDSFRTRVLHSDTIAYESSLL